MGLFPPYIQPYCDQCDANDNCNYAMDSACVFYHPTYPGQTPSVSKLVYLGLPNGSSSQTIFEAIDSALGSVGNQGITPVQSQTVQLIVSGANNRSIQANVHVSASGGNLLEINNDGLFAYNPNPNYLVKVDANSAPDYLFNQLTGDTNGCVSIDILDSEGQVFIRPTFDLNCFATSLCASDTGTKNQIANCLLSTGLQTLDSSSLHLSLSTASPNILTGSIKISATAGNAAVINSDGLYVPSDTGVSAANNGLSLSSDTVQLGGSNLLQNSTIGFASGAYYLQFNSTPQVVLGESAPTRTGIFEIQNTYATGTSLNAGANITTTTTLRASGGGIGSFSNLNITSGTDTDTSVKTGAYGQIFFSGSVTLNDTDSESGYAGVHGIIVPQGTGTVISGSAMPAGVMGGSFVSDDATITNLAAIFGRGVYQSPGGTAYSGTITNYYGLYIEDTKGAGVGSHITNAYGAYIAGTAAGYKNIAETSFTTPSDSRIKENIQDISYGLNEIEKLRPVSYYLIGNSADKKVGFIAQEVESILPEAVSIASLKGISDLRILDKDVIFTIMVNAIKELSTRVKALESK